MTDPTTDELAELDTTALTEVALFAHASDPNVEIVPAGEQDTDADHGQNTPEEMAP